MKVLIIEDQDFKINEVKTLLEKYLIKDFDIAKSVNSSLKSIAKNNYDLIIVDLGLPLFDQGWVQNSVEGFIMLQSLAYKGIKIPTIIYSSTEITEEKKDTFKYLKYPYLGQAKNYFMLESILDDFIEDNCTKTKYSSNNYSFLIATSSHNNFPVKGYRHVSISGNRGKDVNYDGECYPKLAPKLSFWKIWHQNIGKISEEENNAFYIEQYYNQVLANLDPIQVIEDLKGAVLLCYEDNMEFCHRHIVAAWLELTLNIEVPEFKVVNNVIYEAERPAYIKEVLKKVMPSDKLIR